jgi:hypothetical protein
VRSKNGTVLRSLASIVGGLLLSISVSEATCVVSNNGCDMLVRPAAFLLNTGFEGGLVALAAMCLFLWLIFSTCIWFVLRKWGPFRRVVDREDS